MRLFFYIVKWMKWKFLESQSPIHVILQFYSAPQASTISKTSFWIIHGYLLKVVVQSVPLRKSFSTSLPFHLTLLIKHKNVKRGPWNCLLLLLFFFYANCTVIKAFFKERHKKWLTIVVTLPYFSWRFTLCHSINELRLYFTMP